MLTTIIHKPRRSGVNVDNNSINANNNQEIEIEIEIEREIEKEIISIYPSNQNYEENKMLNEMMDEMDRIEFENIINKSEIVKLDPKLCMELQEILKEIYMNPDTKEKIKLVNSNNILYALKQFSVANTRQQIQKPKAYFKQCLLSAMDQTELSLQLDAETIYQEQGSG